MLVGLTGGIGSGKSTVAKLFEILGCAIYNSDERAKELYFESDVKQLVIELLGKEAYLSSSEIDKNYISKKVFEDTLLLHKLNAIIHPAVKTDFQKFVSRFPKNKIIIKETALLFEAGIYKELDCNLLVTASVDVKIERVMKRNSVSKEEVEKRMHAQWTDEKKVPLADFVITNDATQALIPQVLHIFQKLTNTI